MKPKPILLILSALLFSFQIAAQELIFKKNGEVIKAKILTSNDKSLSYKLYEHKDSITYYINTSVIDSIIYRDGKKESYIKKITPVIEQPKELITNYCHHLIGADLTGFLFNKNLIVSYEYLPGNARIGFKAAFALNTDPLTYYNSGDVGYSGDSFGFGRIPKWSTRIGMNYYFYPPRTFRFGTGLYYIFGSYKSGKYIYSSDYSTSTLVTKNNSLNGIILSFFGFYNLNPNMAINLGFDTPLILNPSSTNYVIRCELMLNF